MTNEMVLRSVTAEKVKRDDERIVNRTPICHAMAKVSFQCQYFLAVNI